MNKVFLIGNLTKDPEMRSTQSGVAVCNFTIAVNRRFKNANGKQETDFLNVIAWRQLAELCGKYLVKGRKVAVTGSIQTRTYEAKDGSKRTACSDETRKNVIAALFISMEIRELIFATEDTDHFREELADVIITALSAAGYLGIDIDKAVRAKMEINRGREWRHGK